MNATGNQPIHAEMLTPLGEGGIGVIALAGDGAAALLDRVFVGSRRRASELVPGRLAHGTIRPPDRHDGNRDEDIIDEVIVARLTAAGVPRFEVNCHGGVVAVRSVLRCLIQAGAIAGAPREVAPSRAPLARAAIRTAALEALPHAPTRLGATMLLHQADGALDDELSAVRELIRRRETQRAASRLRALQETAPLAGALLRPPRTALLGPPNAGKSTLFNALLEEERVIVHHEPGTTRDVVCETVAVRGVPFALMDSAGIRETGDEVEREAVGLAEDLARNCDVALILFDAREQLDPRLARAPRTGCRIIVVANKIDMIGDREQADHMPDPALPGTVPLVRISAREHTSIADLEAALLAPYERFLQPCRDGAPMIFAQDHVAAVESALRHLDADRPAEALHALR